MAKQLKPRPTFSIGEIRELGVPVKSVSWVRLHPGTLAGGQPSLLATMGQNNGGLFLLVIDVESGHCQRFPVSNPLAEFPVFAFRSLRNGVLWIGSAWCGHLHRFDPLQPGDGIVDLGAIDPGNVTFPTGMAEDKHGHIYIGGYPGCTLTRFDPVRNEFIRLGKLDSQDQYLYPLVGDDGTVAAQVKFSRYRIMVLDPQTGLCEQVGPVLDAPKEGGDDWRFFKGSDGLLYLDSKQGRYLIRGKEAVAMHDLPPPMAGIHATYRHGYQEDLALPDETRASFADADSFTYRRVHFVSSTGKVLREITLDWEGAGTRLFLLHLGPDRRLYGSSYLPEHLFSCALDGGDMRDHGQVSLSAGEAYSMCNYEGKIAIASYPDARLSLYDPGLPYRFGTGPGSNPLDVGRVDLAGTRPHSMLATPDGKLWIASAADYGLPHGSLNWYDPATTERRTFRALLPNGTPFILHWLQGLQRILIGFNCETGTGTKVSLKKGAFGIWNPMTEELEYIGDFGDPELADVCSLLDAGDGLVYAISGRNPRLLVHHGAKPAPTRLLLLDPSGRRILAAAPLPGETFGQLPFESGHILRMDTDGTIYGATRTRVFRVVNGSVEVELVAKITNGDLSVVGPVVDGVFYFASEWRLRCLHLR